MSPRSSGELPADAQRTAREVAAYLRRWRRRMRNRGRGDEAGTPGQRGGGGHGGGSTFDHARNGGNGGGGNGGGIPGGGGEIGDRFPRDHQSPMGMGVERVTVETMSTDPAVHFLSSFQEYKVDTPSFLLERFEQIRGAWSVPGGTLQFDSGGSDNPTAVAFYLGFNTYADVKVTMRADGDSFGKSASALARWNTVSNTGYAVEASEGSTIKIQRYDGLGAPTTLATFAQFYGATDDIALECVGTTIRARFNGADIGSVVDATYKGGKVGLGSNGSGLPRAYTRFHVEKP